jgi:hypothetical protein
MMSNLAVEAEVLLDVVAAAAPVQLLEVSKEYLGLDLLEVEVADVEAAAVELPKEAKTSP